MRATIISSLVGGLMLGTAFVQAQATTASRDAVTYVPADQVAAAFQKGQPLVETDAYKVHASRREAPGQVEVHASDTDIIYVLDGAATIVTGGTIVDGKSIGPNEVRGASIDGGTTRTLSKGDVLIVPHGVPHWFRSVQGPMTYYVVKVVAPPGGSR